MEERDRSCRASTRTHATRFPRLTISGEGALICDGTATGTTLKENGLVVREEIARSTARLIANPVSHKLKAGAIDALLERLDAV